MIAGTEQLSGMRYLLLTTFAPDGTAVTAPTWVVEDGQALGIWARTDSATVRRLRSHPGVLICGCDSHGRPLGSPLRARAALCDADTTARYRTSLINKYGLTAMLALARSRLKLGLDGTVGVRITLSAADGLLTAPAWRPAATYCPN